jgi:EmrB/QacA subfamily drug resistance transporter
MVASDRTRWYALALICAVQFMVILDIAIVNVALPSIQVDLGFSQENLQWVISAYALVFGGFLLLGGRLADILGRKRVFMAGLVIFSIGSLLCGLAWSDESLIGARALQGLGAATITPAALSILTTTFAEGRERNIALGAWGAVGGFGAAAGVLMGGILTDLLSWEWIFFVNVPVGIAGLVLAPILLSESRDAHGQSHDVPGAVLVTGGLSVLVLGITQGQQWGWGSAATIGTFVASAVLLVAFGLWEQRQREPLVPFSIFRLQTLAAANVAMFVMGTAMFSMFLMLTLYMQQVLGFSPLKTGIGYLAVAGTAVIWANVAAVAVNRVGVKPALILGMSLLTAGLLYFTQVSVDGSYWADLFPGFLILGLAIPFAFVPLTIAALAGTKPQEAGLASGLINTTQQIGGAVGIALLSTIAVSTTEDELATGTAQAVALTDGFVNAFWAGAAIAFVGVLVSVFMIRGRDLRLQETPVAEQAPALDVAA